MSCFVCFICFGIIAPSLLSLFVHRHLSLSPVSALEVSNKPFAHYPAGHTLTCASKSCRLSTHSPHPLFLNHHIALPPKLLLIQVSFLSPQRTPYIKPCLPSVVDCPLVFIISEHPSLLLFRYVDSWLLLHTESMCFFWCASILWYMARLSVSV